MSAEGYAKFLKDMGHSVREAAGVYWFNAHTGVYMSFPFQTEVTLSASDLKTVLGSDGWVARFPCPESQGRQSFRIIMDDPNYDLGNLNSKTRNQTRRGMEGCKSRPLEFSELEAVGIALNKDTLQRQQRRIPSGFEDYWLRYYRTASHTEGALAWGSFVGGELAAYLIAFIMGDCAHILIMRSSAAHLKHYPNNALLFNFMKSVLNSGRVREVSIGLEAIQSEMDSLDHFKIGMGFKKQPIGQQIFLRPILTKILKGPVLPVLSWVVGLKKNDERFTKLAGLLDWYATQKERTPKP